MRKYALYPLVACLLFAFSSCQKSIDGTGGTTDGGGVTPSTYSVSFKANGVQKTYSGLTAAFFSPLAGSYTANFLGEKVAMDTTDGMGIFLTDVNPIATNVTYTEPVVAGTPQAALEYIDATGNAFTTFITLDDIVKVTLTENASDHVSGTFSGNVQSIKDIAAGNLTNIIAITEGSFKVKK